MGIYLPNMEMPTEEQGCFTINIYSDGVVTCYDDDVERKAVPVPPHGRLIDADKLKEANEKRFRELHHPSNNPQDKTAEFVSYANTWANLGVDDAPTIIPAEEGE